MNKSIFAISLNFIMIFFLLDMLLSSSSNLSLDSCILSVIDSIDMLYCIVIALLHKFNIGLIIG